MPVHRPPWLQNVLGENKTCPFLQRNLTLNGILAASGSPLPRASLLAQIDVAEPTTMPESHSRIPLQSDTPLRGLGFHKSIALLRAGSIHLPHVALKHRFETPIAVFALIEAPTRSFKAASHRPCS